MANPTPAKKQWTILVYLAGDNNLSAAGEADLAEMKSIGSTDAVNVVAQFDRAGAGAATTRYLLRRGTSLAEDAVASLGETNCGDPAVLEDFLSWGCATFPAEHVLAVLWNHGAGWDDTDPYRGALLRARGARGVAYDDQARDFLDSLELKRALSKARTAAGGRIDVLGFDACLMSMVEVAYQLRGAIDFLVGSEETEPNDGWPYDRILKALAAKPATTPKELSALIARSYVASYAAKDEVTQSAIDAAALEPVAAAVDALAKALVACVGHPASRAKVLGARAAAQEYTHDAYCDLADLCAKLRGALPETPVAAACAAVEAAVRAAVVESRAKGAAVARSGGLSIYWPAKRLSPLHAKLDFSRKTAWNGFLAALLGATGRAGRAAA